MRFLTLLIAITLSSTVIEAVIGQTSNQAAAVSQDLKEVYQRTTTAATEADVTAIARACTKVIPDQRRSKADREYAANLLAWALNRRGEMRSAAAAKLVEQGQLTDANSLDEKALADYKTAVEYAPSNWRIHHNLAISLAMKGDYKNAIDQFNSVIALKDDYPNAYFNRAELYFELKQYPQAIRDYSKAIDFASNDPQFFNSRAHCRFMLESYDEAIEDYRRAIELGPDSAVYHTDLADALQFRGQWEEAASVYREAIAINGKYPRAYMNAAWLMATCPEEKYRNTELGLSAAKKAVELEGTPSVRALDTLATAYAATGKLAEAVKYERQAMKLATAEDREEISARLALYESGQAYLQPETGEPSSQIQLANSKSLEEKPKVRTASDASSTRKAR